MVLMVIWIFIALAASWIAPYSPVEPHPNDVSVPPSPKYWLGTDKDGMDILSRILYAPRIDLAIAVTSIVLSFLLGVPVGILAGHFGGSGGLLGLLTDCMMRMVDVSLAFPVFVFALVLVAVLGSSAVNVILALAFIHVPIFVWLSRSDVLVVRDKLFVEAARCSGNSELRIAMVHIMPNALASSLTQFSIAVGAAIILTASLSFIGAGVPVPTPEWGLMISQGSSSMITGQWWAALFPGIALASAVLGFSLVGDGLRRYLDPKKRR
jgi:peptide/nickel transport system permease protein